MLPVNFSLVLTVGIKFFKNSYKKPKETFPLHDMRELKLNRLKKEVLNKILKYLKTLKRPHNTYFKFLH